MLEISEYLKINIDEVHKSEENINGIHENLIKINNDFEEIIKSHKIVESNFRGSIEKSDNLISGNKNIMLKL